MHSVILPNVSEKETQAAVQAGVEAGWMRPVIGKEFSLEVAHREILSSRALGRMVINVVSW